MRVAVLGGGPAGAMAAEQLAASGVETVVFDEKLAWEKPCGGGLTCKAYTQYPFLVRNDAPKRRVSETVIAASGTDPVTLRLDHPVVIFSRRELNQLLLDRAAKSGARIERDRVLGMNRTERGWQLKLKNGGEAEADFCIVATGARNPLRDAGTELTPSDAATALGYFVPGERSGIEIQFFEGFGGYIWAFPRAGHLSIGICGKGVNATEMRRKLETWMRDKGYSTEGATYYAHLLPALAPSAWHRNRVTGDGWLAVGDAAGLVDPVTGEGIYYAIRSGDLAARALISNPANPAAEYERAIREEIIDDLSFGAGIANRFYGGNFLAGPITSRMVQFTRRSRRFRSVMQDLFDGSQPYSTLKKRLVRGFPQSIAEVALSFVTA